jgi:hypothetical protein
MYKAGDSKAINDLNNLFTQNNTPEAITAILDAVQNTNW